MTRRPSEFRFVRTEVSLETTEVQKILGEVQNIGRNPPGRLLVLGEVALVMLTFNVTREVLNVKRGCNLGKGLAGVFPL